MNRRSFFKSMIGGVAATAAVRTWPFRVFSFPAEIKIAKNMPLDLGFHCWSFNGIPFIEDTDAPHDRIYVVNSNYVGNPKVLEKMIQRQKFPFLTVKCDGYHDGCANTRPAG